MLRNNKHTKQVWLAAMLLIMGVAIMFFVRDRWLTSDFSQCGDLEGPRPRIDLRNFETHYSRYSMSLEGEIAGRAKLAAKIEPFSLQALSESIQTGQEFRKSLVAGYNACAISRTAYQGAIIRFQVLDSLARRIDSLISENTLSKAQKTALAKLIDEYSGAAGRLEQTGN